MGGASSSRKGLALSDSQLSPAFSAASAPRTRSNFPGKADAGSVSSQGTGGEAGVGCAGSHGRERAGTPRVPLRGGSAGPGGGRGLCGQDSGGAGGSTGTQRRAQLTLTPPNTHRSQRHTQRPQAALPETGRPLLPYQGKTAIFPALTLRFRELIW